MNQAAPHLANGNEHQRAAKKTRCLKTERSWNKKIINKKDCFRQAGSPSFCFPSGSVVKTLPAMQETQEMQVQFLGQEDPLEEGMTTHSSIAAWRIPQTEKPGGLQSMELQRVRHD